MSKYKTEVTYYNYTVKIASSSQISERDPDGRFWITLDNARKKITADRFQFSTPNYPLTYDQVIDRIKGTKGVIRIEGEFAVRPEVVKTKEE